MFYWNPFIFVGYRNDRFLFPYNSLYFECYTTMPMLADAHISSLGYLWDKATAGYAFRFNEKSNKQHENRSIYTKLTNICTTSSPADSLRASSHIWASETSLARTRERAARASGVLARLVSLAQVGELARRLPRGSTDALEFLKCPGPKRTGSACAWRLPVWIGLD